MSIQSLSIIIMQSPRSNPFNPYELPQTARGQDSSYRSGGNQPPPQSSRNNLDSYYFASQPPKAKKEFGMFSRRYLPKENPASVSRSRITQQNMSMSAMGLPEEKLYTEEMLFLLSEEDNNLSFFKEKIDGQKSRASRDFANVRKQLDHVISDLETSIMAELDLVYKTFLEKYGQFKRHMVSLREIKRALLNQLPQEHDDYLTKLNQSRKNVPSNRDLLTEIEKDTQLFRTQKIFSQITDMQKESIAPASQLASELMALGSIEAVYYDERACSQMLQSLVEGVQRESKEAYSSIKGAFVTSPEQLYSQHNNLLNGLSQYENQDDDYEQPSTRGFRSADHKDIVRNFQSPKRDTLKPPDQSFPEMPKRQGRPGSSNSQLQGGISKISRIKEDQGSQVRKSPRNYHMGNLKPQSSPPFSVSSDQQNITAEWLEDVSIREVGVIDMTHSAEALLCCVFACEGKVLVVGSKDKNLRVYEVGSGNLLQTLGGHQANICSLCNHGPLVSSGGDFGCCSLLTWDVRFWTTRSKVQLHSAAVTCIVDLGDGTHLATASYDKKITIFNHKRGVAIMSTNSSNTGIGCMTLTSDKSRLVSAALDNSVSVWRISRETNSITNLDCEKIFWMDSLVCSLRPLVLKPNFVMVGTKDSRVLVVNLLSGQSARRLSVGTSPVLELVLLEREHKPEAPLVLSCLAKEKSLMLTKTDSGGNSLVDVRGRLKVEIGCGIGPKVVVSEGGLMAILSQSPSSKQTLLYQLSPL